MQGIDDKWPALQSWLAEQGVSHADVLYVGNDRNDVDCRREVGCGVAVADAMPEAIDVAAVRLRTDGGCGAIAELVRRLADRDLLRTP